MRKNLAGVCECVFSGVPTTCFEESRILQGKLGRERQLHINMGDHVYTDEECAYVFVLCNNI